MKRNLTLGAIAALALSASAAAAAPINLTDMELNGSANISGGELQLTPSLNGQAGSAFTDAYAIDGTTTFSAHFEFLIETTATAGADGLVFIVQNAGINALGSGGFGIGYAGISPSIAIEFDTWVNSYDPNANHVGLNINGNITSDATANPGFSLESSTSRHAWINYDGTTLDVFLSETDTMPLTALLSQDVSLSGLGTQAFFGFTASTGGARSEHRVLDFDLTVDSTTAPIPLPAGLPLMVAGLAALGLVRRRKS